MSRRLRGLGLFALAGTALFLLMAHEGHVPLATWWGLAALGLCLLGLFQAVGILGRASPDARELSDTWLGPLPGESVAIAPLYMLPLSLVLVVLCAVIAPALLPFAIVAALLVLLPAALRRPGLFVFVVCAGLLLPTLGAFDLWDPWETHYGEVAREILARDDWISLWWAQDRWFWSKPILIFWAEALTWNATTIDFRPDSQFQHAEWILRLPVFALSVLALLSVQQVVARRVGVRAGVLAAIVLATTPYFGFLCHQAITDMYFVACMTVALMLFLLAVAEDPERRVGSLRVLSYELDARHLVLALVLGVGLPQVLYLASRNVALIDGFLFAWHLDDFPYGSAGNPDVPGNFGYRLHRPHYRELWFQPMAQALVWAIGLFAIARSLRHERRAQALLMTGFYLFCALAFMGKGIPGFALPGLVALLFLLVSERWALLLSGRLRVGQGMLIIAVLSLPWFVAMYMRHGPAFTDRLLIHDHINRLTKGVHGDKGSVQYFINQLGYGLFPWIALAPAALGAWLARTGRALSSGERDAHEAIVVVGLWFAAAFTLFSAMTTKFHHYIFPAVPAAAILVGVTLDRMLGRRALSVDWRSRLGTVAAVLATVPLVLAAAGSLGDVRGVLPPGLDEAKVALWSLQHGWPWWAVLAGLALGAAMLALSEWLQRAARDEEANDWGLSAALLAGVAFAAFAGRDLSWTTSKRPIGNELLAHLFIYNYDRPWPSELDYRAPLGGFAIVVCAITLLSAFRRFRPLMAQALVGLGLLFSVFCLDVYMLDATPHWTQGHLVRRYYALRDGAEQPLVAWQMNWKGENFYTGNRVFVFQDLDNKKITKWIDENKDLRAFFILEHKRLSRFKRLLKDREVKELSTERDCNKFVLVEAVL